MPVEYSEMNSISRNNESSANANSPLPMNRKIFDYSKIDNIAQNILNMNSSPKINNSEIDEYSNQNLESINKSQRIMKDVNNMEQIQGWNTNFN